MDSPNFVQLESRLTLLSYKPDTSSNEAFKHLLNGVDDIVTAMQLYRQRKHEISSRLQLSMFEYVKSLALKACSVLKAHDSYNWGTEIRKSLSPTFQGYGNVVMLMQDERSSGSFDIMASKVRSYLGAICEDTEHGDCDVATDCEVSLICGDQGIRLLLAPYIALLKHKGIRHVYLEAVDYPSKVKMSSRLGFELVESQRQIAESRMGARFKHSFRTGRLLAGAMHMFTNLWSEHPSVMCLLHYIGTRGVNCNGATPMDELHHLQLKEGNEDYDNNLLEEREQRYEKWQTLSSWRSTVSQWEQDEELDDMAEMDPEDLDEDDKERLLHYQREAAFVERGKLAIQEIEADKDFYDAHFEAMFEKYQQPLQKRCKRKSREEDD
eukprot:10323-Heterococcus_DN1.PRE.2